MSAKKNAFVPDATRVAACVKATYQIEGLLEVLCKTSGNNATDSFPWMAQSVAIRLNELNSLIANALSMEDTTDDDIHQALYGPMVTGDEVSA